MKLAIVISKLEQGGIPTALCSLLREISQNPNFKITLFVFCKINYSRFRLPKNVEVVYPSIILDSWFRKRKGLGIKDAILWYPLHILGVKLTPKPIYFIARKGKKYGNYDVAISYENDIPASNINFMVNDFVLNRIEARKKISWIHNDPYRLGFTASFIERKYKDFNIIVNVSEACKNKFDTIFPGYKEKSKLVYNCVDFEEVKREKVNVDMQEDVRGSNKEKILRIISISRLSNPQKRIDRMIETCVILKKRGLKEKFSWELYGDGPDENMLKKLAKDKGVTDVFKFCGKTRIPLILMNNSDVFVMSSDYEAFGLTLLESQIANTPVIVTDFPEAKESIVDGYSGYIVEKNPVAIADAIEKLICKPEELIKMRDYILEHPITNKRALEQFYSLFDSKGLGQ